MSLTATAEILLACAKKLDQYAATEGLTWDSKLETRRLSEEAIEMRDQMVDAAQGLQARLLGSWGTLFELVSTFHDTQCVRAIVHFNVPANVPDEGISFHELAAKVNLEESVLTRLVRLAMMSRIFHEPRPGIVDHTTLSKSLATPNIFDAVNAFTEELHPALFHVVASLEKWPVSQEPNHTGWNLAQNTNDPFFPYLAKHPDRARRAAGLFHGLAKHALTGPTDFTSSALWRALDAPGNVLVDVGGGMGQISQELATITKDLAFIVEDLPDTCAFGEKELPAQFCDRITFRPHDFFTEQPVSGADAYFMRMIMHDWPDKYCIKILQNIVPALKDGARVVCCEVVLPEAANPSFTEKKIRRMDLSMLAVHNATERTETQWRSLFAQVDPRFKVEFESWPHAVYGLVIATWNAQGANL